jgi:hypothetical protein
MENKYIEVNGTSYQKGTPKEVIDVLENARTSRTRIKLYYGDHETGKDWKETMDTVGTIGRSTGSIKVPLLIKLSKSTGGGAILTDSIVKIKDVKTGKVLYQTNNYKQPKVEIIPSDMKHRGYTHNVMVDGDVYGRHKSLKSAQILQSKIMAKGSTIKGEGKSTYKYYKVPNEQLWAIQECNSAFEDGWGSTCVVIDTRKSEAQAIEHVKHLTKLQLEADSKYAKGYMIEFKDDQYAKGTKIEERLTVGKDGYGNWTVFDSKLKTNHTTSSSKRLAEEVRLDFIKNPKTLKKYEDQHKKREYAKGGNTPSEWCYSIGGL